MRNQFLAHIDMTRESSRLKISGLKEILDSVCGEFNNVCDAIDDEAIEMISDVELGMIEIVYTMEMAALYERQNGV